MTGEPSVVEGDEVPHLEGARERLEARPGQCDRRGSPSSRLG